MPGPRQRRRSRGDQTSGTHTLQVEEEGGAESAYSMFQVRDSMADETEPIKVTMLVNGADLEMEVDAGASSSIISAATYRKSWPRDQGPPLHPVQKRLCTYTRELLKVKGAFIATVQYENQTAELELVVVGGAGPSLLGRDWLQLVRPDWEGLNQISTATPKALTPQEAFQEAKLQATSACLLGHFNSVPEKGSIDKVTCWDDQVTCLPDSVHTLPTSLQKYMYPAEVT